MNRTAHIIILFFSVLTLDFTNIAANPDSLFYKGNTAYAEGNFEEAIEYYQTILDSGYASAAVYYNLGNAYFKANETTRAILNYERAKLLSPKDEEIQFNLELARTFVVDNIEPLPEFILVTYYKKFVNSLSVDGWAYFSVGTFVFAILVFIIALFSSKYYFKKTGFITGIVLILFTLFTFAMAGVRKSWQEEHHTAIIFSPNVTVKSAPDESGTDLFVLHEGTKVKIVDAVGEWNEIVIASGNKGWIKTESIEEI